LPEFTDDRGRLMFAEEARHIPFPVKRIFAIYGTPPGKARGDHAHRVQHQFVIMLAGGCTLIVCEEKGKYEERLESPVRGLYVPPLVWLELKDFSAGAVCLVLTSDRYDESDYIRDYAEFRQLAAARDGRAP